MSPRSRKGFEDVEEALPGFARDAGALLAGGDHIIALRVGFNSRLGDLLAHIDRVAAEEAYDVALVDEEVVVDHWNLSGLRLAHQAVGGVGVDRRQHQHVDALGQHVLDLRGLQSFVGVGGLCEHLDAELGGLFLEERLIGVAPTKLIVVGHDKPDFQLLVLRIRAFEAGEQR